MWKSLYIARALSEGQCGIAMIDTLTLRFMPFYMRKKSLKMWKRLYIAGSGGQWLQMTGALFRWIKSKIGIPLWSHDYKGRNVANLIPK